MPLVVTEEKLARDFAPQARESARARGQSARLDVFVPEKTLMTLE